MVVTDLLASARASCRSGVRRENRGSREAGDKTFSKNGASVRVGEPIRRRRVGGAIKRIGSVVDRTTSVQWKKGRQGPVTLSGGASINQQFTRIPAVYPLRCMVRMTLR